MAGLFEPRGTQFYTGMYYPQRPTLQNREKGEKFNYEKVSDETANYSQPIRNLVTKQKRLSISTTAPIKWKVGGYVLTQSGQMWVIESWGEDEPINPQVAYFLRRNLESAMINLVEVDNPLGLTV